MNVKKDNYRKGPKKGYYKNKNQKYKNRDHSTKKSPSIIKTYSNLFNQYVTDRKTYFDAFNNAPEGKIGHYRDRFYNSLNKLRNFEESLDHDQRYSLQKAFPELELDLTYSTNKNVTSGDNRPSDDQEENPHLLPNQVDHSFSDDSEQSVGTIEDYNNYKATKN